MSTGITNVHVDVGADKVSIKTRSDRAVIVGKMATVTPLYQSDPFFKDTVDKLVHAGQDLDSADAVVTQLEAELIKARSTRDVQRSAYDKAHGLCSISVETHSARSEDVHGFGFAVQSRATQVFAPPASVEARYDAAKGVIRIHAHYASGHHQCAIEISPDPVGPGSYKRLDGSGVTQTLAGYAPGTYWVRAATVRAKDRTDWFGPVAVVVK